MIVINEPTQAALKRGRTMYIFEALFEYLISILVSGSFLATLTGRLGISDSTTGILSSIISLGCLFQILSVTIRVRRSKGFVITLSIVNQALFMFLYVIPLTGFDRSIKILLFVVCIISAYLIYNVAHPKKINWLMSLVDDNKRGSFTANKEIISLIGGIVFSFGMGAVIDGFMEAGKTRLAFAVSAMMIFVLTAVHTATLVMTVEKTFKAPKRTSLWQSVTAAFKNKSILKVTLVFIIYYIANYAATPFYGTYMINELGFNLKTVSFLSIFSSVTRISVSRLWGKYADKKSFAVMIEKCFVFLALSIVCVIFATPKTGVVMFILYYALHGIAMGGVNSALINLVFDYAPLKMRADALAISQAAAGVFGFLTTLCISPLVSFVQKNGNSIFGIGIYAQQLVSIVSLAFVVVTIIYVRKVLIKDGKRK